ncbi:cyclic AMP-dependent transcription factor ATF-4-like [Mizuhopecten yessoensis]|uniref:Activating transcription factor 4 n=1 Tax=Mizuhopecten yessoensis TaxID=6573 RepID=A0A210PRC3_MIZYE|nr:cyclic AMP-dependent transcription factor ATF-4-like [Mizuhopecten yessoensis]AXM05356.1 activating transcription factor 4 [Mizuhopecten yessoensis]OWF38986.1 Cyclic AMP-dependent transcription factor ATF-4 [Mizuhopecten yessoensis]
MTNMELFDMETLRSEFLVGDLAGSFPQSSGDDDIYGLGTLFPGDTLSPAKGLQPTSGLLDEFLAPSPEDPLGEEWMENSAFDLEHAFGLTDLGDVLTAAAEPVIPESPTSSKPKNSGILHELLVQPMSLMGPVVEPEHQMIDIDLLDCVTEVKDCDVAEGILSLLDQNESVQVQHIQPEISVDTSSTVDSIIEQFITSPLSVDEVENFLSSSEPSSPEPASVEQSICDDPDYTPGCSDDEMNPPTSKSSSGKAKKATKSRIRAEPYEIPTEGLSKKERKKIQNRNAAIRYREKKRGEKLHVNTDEQTLVETNQKLHDKVDSISREIKYMKDLMTEVFKAKGLKISFK